MAIRKPVVEKLKAARNRTAAIGKPVVEKLKAARNRTRAAAFDELARTMAHWGKRIGWDEQYTASIKLNTKKQVFSASTHGSQYGLGPENKNTYIHDILVDPNAQKLINDAYKKNEPQSGTILHHDTLFELRVQPRQTKRGNKKKGLPIIGANLNLRNLTEIERHREKLRDLAEKLENTLKKQKQEDFLNEKKKFDQQTYL